MPEAFNIARFLVDQADWYRPPINLLNGGPLYLARSKDTRLEVGIYRRGGFVPNPAADIVLITAEVKTTRTAAAVVTASTAVITGLTGEGVFTGGVTEEGRITAGTGQHAVILLPRAQTASFVIGASGETDHWIVLTATGPDGNSFPLIAGRCVAVEEGGSYSATVPTPADPAYYTKAETEARLAGLADKVISENGFRGYWGIENGAPKWRRLQ